MPETSAAAKGVATPEFERLFVENQRRIFAYILTLLPRIEDAREVFQNVCVVLLKKSEQYEDGTDFAKWACRVAHFEVCNYCRQRRRELLVLDNEVLESLSLKRMEMLEDAERRKSALEKCLAKLRPQDRCLIETRYRRNVTTRQLAVEMARPEDTVYKALQRIRRCLQQCIERQLTSEERGDG